MSRNDRLARHSGEAWKIEAPCDDVLPDVEEAPRLPGARRKMQPPEAAPDCSMVTPCRGEHRAAGRPSWRHTVTRPRHRWDDPGRVCKTRRRDAAGLLVPWGSDSPDRSPWPGCRRRRLGQLARLDELALAGCPRGARAGCWSRSTGGPASPPRPTWPVLADPPGSRCRSAPRSPDGRLRAAGPGLAPDTSHASPGGRDRRPRRGARHAGPVRPSPRPPVRSGTEARRP